ncbi:MAG: YeeE/YedE thiosulfate transporter family protein [Polyangiaceae bacterium]
MTLWPWPVAAAALAAVMVAHWFATDRMMAVSGRITALMNRAVGRVPADETTSMSDAELLEAVRQATLEAFGAEALAAFEAANPPPPPSAAAPRARAAQTPSAHIGFLMGLVLGGALSVILNGTAGLTFGLRSADFAALTGRSPIWTIAILFVGGVFVGAGTRMAGGCTSGHGLCGVSRLQPGSLLATLSFFAAGIGTSFLLQGVM